METLPTDGGAGQTPRANEMDPWYALARAAIRGTIITDLFLAGIAVLSGPDAVAVTVPTMGTVAVAACTLAGLAVRGRRWA